ncbi:MAG: OmpA family protein [Candidatus Cloacimonetes bacterium]|nr:OmpA family protein [Candidatus Cloacimonadota bacterium]
MELKKILFFSFLVILFFANLNAQIDGGMVYLGAHFSGIQLIGGEENSKIKCWTGLNAGVFFSKQIGLELNASTGWTQPHKDQNSTQYVTYLYPITANLRFNFAKDKKFIPYGFLGGGLLHWDLRDVTNETDDIGFFDRKGHSVNGAMQKDFIINTGAGFNYFFTRLLAFDTSLRYHQIVEHGDDLSGYNDQHTVALELRAGFTFFFGGPKDTDKDGVKNKYDFCPETPKGIEVDSDGCPIDSDEDGVPNYKDKCSNTPDGVKVDSNGCAVDSDKDGIADYIDKCANTPKRAKVDKNGCPIDSDKDGVADYKDKCSNTPDGVKVDSNGCAIDSDKDGIADYEDKCPNTPEGVKIDLNGCPIDTDEDGIADYQDKCANTPKGIKVDNNGCALDTDYDGIPDHKDKCPRTKIGVQVDRFGCEIIKFEAEKPIILDGVTFASGKSVLTLNAKTTLTMVLKTLENYPEMKLAINGYTDNTGSLNYNVTLSKKRAEAVMNFFINSGIDADRLSSKGFGPKDPIAPNNTKEGRARNRRIEFLQVK